MVVTLEDPELGVMVLLGCCVALLRTVLGWRQQRLLVLSSRCPLVVRVPR